MYKFTILSILLSLTVFSTTQAWTTKNTAYDVLPPKPYKAPPVKKAAVKEEKQKKPDEMKETVRALFRVFQLGDKASGNDYPALSRPMGWSGEVGNGPTTAYDCLPPKPYKAPVVEEEVATAKKVVTEEERKHETARAIFRVFQLGDKASGNDYPSLSKPTGWSGEIGDGPKTAYDCLPPKKYNPNLKP